jgi:hypothetical protein
MPFAPSKDELNENAKYSYCNDIVLKKISIKPEKYLLLPVFV